MSQPKTTNPRTGRALLLGAGGIALVIGSFMPWIEASAAFVGSLSRNGVSGGGDGLITLACGVVAGALAYAYWSAKTGTWIPVLAILAGLAGLAVVIYDGMDISERTSSLSSEFAIAQVGSGIYVAGAGAALVLIMGLLLMGAKQGDTPPPPPPPVARPDVAPPQP